MFEKSAEFVIPRYSEGSRDGENSFESRDPSEYLGMTGLNVGTVQTPSEPTPKDLASNAAQRNAYSRQCREYALCKPNPWLDPSEYLRMTICKIEGSRPTSATLLLPRRVLRPPARIP